MRRRRARRVTSDPRRRRWLLRVGPEERTQGARGYPQRPTALAASWALRRAEAALPCPALPAPSGPGAPPGLASRFVSGRFVIEAKPLKAGSEVCPVLWDILRLYGV